MKLKTMGLVLGGLAGVLVLAVVLFFVFFPKQLAAREAERRIEAATHRQLTLGEVELAAPAEDRHQAEGQQRVDRAL